VVAEDGYIRSMNVFEPQVTDKLAQFVKAVAESAVGVIINDSELAWLHASVAEIVKDRVLHAPKSGNSYKAVRI
jgi:hypothetical protein